MMAPLVSRLVQLIDLPLAPGVTVLRPEQAVLRFDHGKTIDIGALCYLERDFSDAYRRPIDGKLVVPASLSAARVGQVRQLIGHIDTEMRLGGRRPETIRDMVSRFAAFMIWADTHTRSNVLASAADAREATKAYVAFIRDRVARNEISMNSGARQLGTVVQLLGDFLEVDDLARGLNLLRVSSRNKQSTRPPSEDAQARSLRLAESLFEGICSLVLDNGQYPHAVDMPEYLEFPRNWLWLFPTISWFMSPSMLANRDAYRWSGQAYNFAEGRLATLDELRRLNGFAGDCDNRRKGALHKARAQLATANGNPHHVKRRDAAAQAANMFVIQFIAQTGMNWAQLTALTWTDGYEVEASHQAFRTIKWRAGGKLVSFELPAAFMPAFKRYLALRAYLLNGVRCDLLFFKLGPNRKGAPGKIRDSGLHATYNMLRRIDPTLPKVSTRQWRAAKSDWLVRNTDPATAALVLQNTEKTVLASYAEGSETEHQEEMSLFFDKVSAMVIDRGVSVEGATPRAVGLCAMYGEPSAPVESPVRPDCKGPEGCLFCDKFKVHADEADTRKLLSCRYCLQQTAPLMGSEERIQHLLGPIFDRIQFIVAEVASRDAAMVARVTAEVEQEGELDLYWARKLEMLMDLGVVA